jgi:hypothetical protein
MPESVSRIYEEARSVAEDSPRAAAALLRLSLQQLLQELGSTERNLDDAVGNLVATGKLPAQLQQAMDSLRVIGNNAVHPGEIDLNENPELVAPLFDLVNMIVDFMIAEPRRVAELFSRLPQGALDAIERRDSRRQENS